MSKAAPASFNRFAYLDSDGEDGPAVAVAPAAAPVAPKTLPHRAPRRDNRPAAAGPVRATGDVASRPARPPRVPRAPREGEAAPNTNGTEDEVEKSGDRRRRNVARTSNSEHAPVHGRRMDRKSGTGRGSEMKKRGAGGHNWGDAGAEGAVIADASAGGSPTNANADNAAGAEDSTIVEPKEKADDVQEYAVWLKEQKAKRATVETVKTGARSVDASALENEGYERYVREDETEEERTRRENRMKLASTLTAHDDSEDDANHGNRSGARPKTLSLYEFTGGLGRRKNNDGKRGGNRRDERRGGPNGGNAAPQKNHSDAPANPSNLDFADQTAFPNLL